MKTNHSPNEDVSNPHIRGQYDPKEIEKDVKPRFPRSLDSNLEKCSTLPSPSFKEMIDKMNFPPLIEAIKMSFLPPITFIPSRNIVTYRLYQLTRRVRKI